MSKSRLQNTSLLSVVALILIPVFTICISNSIEIGQMSGEQLTSHTMNSHSDYKSSLNTTLELNDVIKADVHPLVNKKAIPSLKNRLKKFASQNHNVKQVKLPNKYLQEVPVTDSHYPFYFDVLVQDDLDGLLMHCTALDSFEGRLAISNLLGKELLVKNLKFEKGQYKLQYNTKHLNKGHYLVHISNEDYDITKKIFIENQRTEILTYNP